MSIVAPRSFLDSPMVDTFCRDYPFHKPKIYPYNVLMTKLVFGNCEECGSKQVLVTNERIDGTIDGVCPQCDTVFSGFFVVISSTPNIPFVRSDAGSATTT